jgi:hypothetical protein
MKKRSTWALANKHRLIYTTDSENHIIFLQDLPMATTIPTLSQSWQLGNKKLFHAKRKVIFAKKNKHVP